LPIPAAATGPHRDSYRQLEVREGEATLTGAVLSSGQPLVVTDVAGSPYLGPRLAAVSGARSGVALPLMVGERKLGAALVAFYSDHRFTPQEIARAEQAARQIALAIAQAQLLDETRRRADELAMLVEVSTALRAARSADDMLPIFLRKACDVTGAIQSGIFLVEPGSGDLVMRACHPPNSRLIGLRHKPGEGITGRVAVTGQPHFSPDLNADPQAVIEPAGEKDYLRTVRSALAVPLRTHEAIIGVLHVGLDRPRTFGPSERHLLTAIAEVAGSALQRANLLETLEQRVEARTRELARANERLQELDRLKDQFISNVSHELRTPLTNIKLHLGLLDKRGAEVLPRYLPVLQRETERLRRLIEDLLDLSRLQAQIAPPHRERIPAHLLLADVLALHETRAEARSLVVEQRGQPPLLEFNVDRHQIFQVFTNLIANAVAYTPIGGRVQVSTRLAARAGRPGVEVLVHNTGVIPADDLPHLFKRFFRGRTGVESGEAGTGLGLAICKEIVEQHGGEIGVSSSDGAGTTFSVWLPQGD
jgi:signal transduction histidine kinase